MDRTFGILRDVAGLMPRGSDWAIRPRIEPDEPTGSLQMVTAPTAWRHDSC